MPKSTQPASTIRLPFRAVPCSRRRHLAPTPGAFFRVFGCETVEIELTDIKSSTYVRLSHLNTSTQNL
jgi:hypothetical protein